MTNEIIHCDKCGATDVLHEVVMPPTQDVHYTMSEYAEKGKRMHPTYDVYMYTNYRMVCKSCGHIVRYQA